MSSPLSEYWGDRSPSSPQSTPLISANSRPTCTEFATLIDMDNEVLTVVHNITFLEIQDGGSRHIGKYTKMRILTSF